MAMWPSPIPTAPRLIRQPLRITHGGQLLLLTSYFVSYRLIHQRGGGAGRVTGLCVRLSARVCECVHVCVSGDEGRCETHAADGKPEWFYVVPT